MSLLLPCLVLVVAQPPAPPPVPPQFAASCVMETAIGVETPFSPPTPCRYVYDRLGRQQRTSIYSKSVIAPEAWVGTPYEYINTTTYVEADGVYFVINGQTRKNRPATSFGDPFSWVQYATYAGDGVIRGRPVREWRLLLPNDTGSLSYYASKDSEPLPVAFFTNSSLSTFPGVPPSFIAINTTLVADYTTKVGPEDFPLNKTAAAHPTRCPVPASDVAEAEMYIFHPRGAESISGQDAADATGDTAFVCGDLLQNSTRYSLVSLYIVRHYPRFGQYQVCNGYPSSCVGAETWLVGREATAGLSPVMAGECSENNMTGTWFSLPVRGQCGAGQDPAGGTVCTWSARRVKTVEPQCLVERGLLKACLAEGRLPFPNTTAIFRTAFARNDPAQGGCPAVAP